MVARPSRRPRHRPNNAFSSGVWRRQGCLDACCYLYRPHPFQPALRIGSLLMRRLGLSRECLLVSGGDSGDPRLKLVYEESVRGWSLQSSVLDELRNRTGILLAAASVSSAFLGSADLTRHETFSTLSVLNLLGQRPHLDTASPLAVVTACAQLRGPFGTATCTGPTAEL